jgi:putative IMPACT (imprinted ancient) family translation regulator
VFSCVSYYQSAYRFTEQLPGSDTDTRILKHDNDDDGEDAAGSRLAHLLEMRHEDGVFVVVSRWFGGIKLGPKRFAHITNVAGQLLLHCHEHEWKDNS